MNTDMQKQATTDNPPITTFKTDNINLASFIKARGGVIIRVGVKDGILRRYYFEFEDVDFCDKLKYDFLNNADGIQDFVETREMFVNQVKSLGRGFQ